MFGRSQTHKHTNAVYYILCKATLKKATKYQICCMTVHNEPDSNYLWSHVTCSPLSKNHQNFDVLFGMSMNWSARQSMVFPLIRIEVLKLTTNWMGKHIQSIKDRNIDRWSACKKGRASDMTPTFFPKTKKYIQKSRNDLFIIRNIVKIYCEWNERRYLAYTYYFSRLQCMCSYNSFSCLLGSKRRYLV